MTARRALLVACSEYTDPNLRRLRSPVHDVAALGAVLADPQIGRFGVDLLMNRPEVEVRRTLGRFLRTSSRLDTLLVFFACHGYKDIDGQLYFAVTDTDLDDLLVSAVPASLVNLLLNRSPARRTILILDCCFSGAISRSMTYRGGDDVEVGALFEGEGRAVLTASKAEEYALDVAAGPVSLRDNALHSVFATALLDGLRTGAADTDGDGLISADDLYHYVHARVLATGSAQTPSRWSFGHGNLIIAYRPPASMVASGPEASRGTRAARRRTPWDAAVLNWRYPVTSEAERLIRTESGAVAETGGWGAVRNGEWALAGTAFARAVRDRPASPSGWWGRALSHAALGEWGSAGDCFAQAAQRAAEAAGEAGGEPRARLLALCAGASLLGTVTFEAAGDPRASELLDSGVDAVPFCPKLLAHRAVRQADETALGQAIVLDPELCGEFAAVGDEVAVAASLALAEAESMTSLLVRSWSRIQELSRQVPELAVTVAVHGRIPHTMGVAERLRAHRALVGAERERLAEQVGRLHRVARELLDTAVDSGAMALVAAVRDVIAEVNAALSGTDRPKPISALGIPPRINQ
jgi:hypothetical protein